MPSVIPEEQPVRVVVDDDRTRHRATVLFRLVLAVPHLLWLLLWTSAVLPAGFVVWAAVVIEGRAPRVLHDFLAAYVRYASHLTAYLALAAGPYPSFTGEPGYPVDVTIAPPTRQGRWGAAFRLILALPAMLLSATLGASFAGYGHPAGVLLTGSIGALWVAGMLAWFAALARGAVPRGLRDLAVYAIGYGARTTAYALLLTDRYPSADPGTEEPAPELPPHAVRVEVRDPLRRSRLTVAFRLLLGLPHLLWLTLWSLVAVVCVVAAWLVALVTARVPRLLHRFLASYVRYVAQVTAFLTLVGGPFPGFVGAPGYPVDLLLPATPKRQPRATVLFRGVLAIPAILVATAYGAALAVVAFLGWFAALATGRMPRGLRDLGVAAVRYSTQLDAYLLLLTADYPYAGPALRDAPRDVQLELDLADADA